MIGCDDSNSPNSDEEGEEQIKVTAVVKFSEVQSCVLTLQTYMEQRSNDTQSQLAYCWKLKSI